MSPDHAPPVQRKVAPIPHSVPRLDDPVLERSGANHSPARLTSGSGHFPVDLGAGEPLGRGMTEHGLDLSQIRVHHDGAAAQLTEAHGANAVAVGGHVAFAPGKFRPGTLAGDRLIDHELDHVAQQAEAGVAVIQRDGPEGHGIGRSAPEAEYDIEQDGEAGTEDFSFTFGHDSAAVGETWVDRVREQIGGVDGPITVEVHGYASDAGTSDYNLNLSAHRAVAVAQLLRQLLPEGSVVTVTAHGGTTAFGDNVGDNRRVGVDIIDEAPATSGMLQMRRPTWGLQLRQPTLGLPDLDIDPTQPSLVVPPILGAPILPSPAPPWMPQINVPRPPAPNSAETLGFDMSAMHLAAQRRGVTLGPGDEEMLRWHYATYFNLATLLYRIGGRAAFDSPAELANALTSKATDAALAGDNPTLLEQFNSDFDRDRQLLGLPTGSPVVFPVFTREF